MIRDRCDEINIVLEMEHGQRRQVGSCGKKEALA